MQVVRPFSGHELRVNELGVMSLVDVTAQEWIGIGVVIELTEERSGTRFRSSSTGKSVPHCRFVSEWELVDGD